MSSQRVMHSIAGLSIVSLLLSTFPTSNLGDAAVTATATRSGTCNNAVDGESCAASTEALLNYDDDVNLVQVKIQRHVKSHKARAHGHFQVQPAIRTSDAPHNMHPPPQSLSQSRQGRLKQNQSRQGMINVAVVGGGIGGATTVLELLRHPNVHVTLFEQANQIGHPKSASGIIAASLIFNSQDQYWHVPADPTDDDDDDDDDGNDDDDLSDFVKEKIRLNLTQDTRISKDYQRVFFRQARKRLEEQVDSFPSLCGAIIGPYCCRADSPARAWMDANGENCSAVRGWAHTFLTEEEFYHANQSDKAESGKWQISDESSELSEIEEFLGEDNLAGALFNDADEGFMRVEDLFPTFTEIFQNSLRVKLAMNCEVTSFTAHDDDRVEVHAPCADAGVFDKVIVSAGANSLNTMAATDTKLDAELLPVKGFACATNQPLIRNDLRGLGVQVEEKNHYIRPQRNGGIRYGFGAYVMEAYDGLDLLNPSYETDWEDKSEGPEHGIKQTALGRKVLAQSDVMKLAGIRPLSVYGNFPILKVYESFSSNLILNTGYGWHGFVMSWKNAELAASLALDGAVPEEWEGAFTTVVIN